MKSFANSMAAPMPYLLHSVHAIRRRRELFPPVSGTGGDRRIFCTGRTEIGGNHTDHQHGCVLAASVDLDVIAIVAFHDEHVIRLQSAGYPQDYVDLCDLTVQPEEKGSPLH